MLNKIIEWIMLECFWHNKNYKHIAYMYHIHFAPFYNKKQSYKHYAYMKVWIHVTLS